MSNHFLSSSEIESTIGMLERRIWQLEAVNQLMYWLQCGSYRILMHRHDGNFRAIDQALKVNGQDAVWESDCIHKLYGLIEANQPKNTLPHGERE